MAPGPKLQRINALLHQEPFASISYSLFWIFILCVVTPAISVLVLIPLAVYRVLAWRFDWIGVDEFDPMKHEETELGVVVTGCDSGFGKEIALWAASAGYTVFAGCLKKESFQNFDVQTKDGQIVPLVMDVTSDRDVANAFTQVSKWLNEGGTKSGEKKRVLHCLFNNAGIGAPGFFDWLDVSDYEKVMNVNFFGVLRTCKAFLPILKEQKLKGTHEGGRIINLTSIGGLMPGGAVGSAYLASKHATQTFTESLRKELAHFGIQVCSIAPTVHNTPMVTSSTLDITRAWNKMAPKVRENYDEDVLKDIIKVSDTMMSTFAWNLDVVVREAVKAMKCREPKALILVGMDAPVFGGVVRMLPGWLHGFNPVPKQNVSKKQA